MTHSDDKPRTLLRRLLTLAERGEQLSTSTNAPIIASDGEPLILEANPASITSPIQPKGPEVTASPPPIRPKLHLNEPIVSTAIPSTEEQGTVISVEKRLKAETALVDLRKKTATISLEFSHGKLNRAQFTALYQRYQEMREIIERMLMQDPATEAWKRVTASRHTTFLRQHFEARILSYSLFTYRQPQRNLSPIQEIAIDPVVSDKALAWIAAYHHKNSTYPVPSGKEVGHGRWLVVVAGQYAATLVLFSLEPSVRQIRLTQDIHSDFERANHHILERGVHSAEQLVFPHRELLNRRAQ